ncbi:NADH dehydrogenase [ubiquinone] 1 alpha subcomplex subunit 4-like 2 [Corticium candelabrum]|uniref:NADH dehydrogenase [ubiquinone] 1 alpha subcomplex subunit 4-like 2 n=1 Tax=Corticium candelabrum TaxID=121492 RepID=UPI002E25CC97|nr:NADH dehydrogenase [ubiquinone] 1 alpha subcomplex subunit 4-like 2 [Corticium candelabrum]
MASMMKRILRDAVHHKEILPLLGLVTLASTAGVGLLVRAAFKNPDVVLNHKTNPHPWLQVKPNEVYRLLPLDQASDVPPKY